MYIICYDRKPATFKNIYFVEDRILQLDRLTYIEQESYIACRTKAMTIALFLYHIGFTWKERAKGIEIRKIEARGWIN